ncbi:ABC-three component system middle component 6 [Azospirillum sp. TSO35-2]|uniref:ABC-three component system middle component 6 n=1 Tax=Azospirillum sp. TSO35-2 TaxID=716796 RepID=UPI000D658BB1|nr:ABC-three component system middle component 6 [Azospirillum sp. TSO35-2]
MILPTKHLRPERALLTVGAELLSYLHEPMTVSRLWDELRNARAQSADPAPVNYDWFILALDLLFTVGAIEFDRGLIRKTSS